MSVSQRAAKQSYYPRGGSGVSEGLKRARAPFLVRNLVTGTIVGSFALGVYFYSISAVKQDDFSDVMVPAMTADERRATRSIEDEHRERDRAKLAVARGNLDSVPGLTRQADAVPPSASPSSSSVLGRLRTAFPGRTGGPSSFFVHAPPVDKLGKATDASPAIQRQV